MIKSHYPGQKLLLSEDIQDSEIKWLIDLTDAYILRANLIQEPVNQLNGNLPFFLRLKKIGDSAGFKVEF